MTLLPEKLCEALIEAREMHGWSEEDLVRKVIMLHQDLLMEGEAIFCKETGEVVRPSDVHRREDGDIEHEVSVYRLT